MQISGSYSSKVVVGLEVPTLNQLRIVQSQDPKEIWDHPKTCSQQQIKGECLAEALPPTLSSTIGTTSMSTIVTEQDIRVMQKILL